MTVATLWSLVAEYVDSGVLWPYMVAPSAEMNILMVIIRWQSVPGMKLSPLCNSSVSANLIPTPPTHWRVVDYLQFLLIAYSTQNW